jgi:hypothetical protein
VAARPHTKDQQWSACNVKPSSNPALFWAYPGL